MLPQGTWRLVTRGGPAARAGAVVNRLVNGKLAKGAKPLIMALVRRNLRRFIAEFAGLFSAGDGTLVWNLGFEITQPGPEGALVQVDFRDADRAPVFGLGKDAA